MMFKINTSSRGGSGPGTRPLSLKRMISADQLSTSAGASVNGFDTQGLQGYPPTGNGARDIGALFDSAEMVNDSKDWEAHRGLAG